MRLDVELILVDVSVFLSKNFLLSFVVLSRVFLFRNQNHSVLLSEEVGTELLLLLLDEILLDYDST
jgi:hypothetical protein